MAGYYPPVAFHFRVVIQPFQGHLTYPAFM